MTVEHFHKEPPPVFRGLDPSAPLVLYERHLPHWRQAGATYAVTFRLGDSLPQAKLNELRRYREAWERDYPPPRSESQLREHAQNYMRLLEPALDEGYGECVFRDQSLAQLMADTFLHFQSVRYFVGCFVVMPNHCHIVVRPAPPFQLEEILNSWKGFVGHEINRRLGRVGRLWQQESYDRIIRDEEHLYRVVQYIGNNPAKAGLPRSGWCRWIANEWQDAGWDFDAEGR